jgi:hypothetical protein
MSLKDTTTLPESGVLRENRLSRELKEVNKIFPQGMELENV